MFASFYSVQKVLIMFDKGGYFVGKFYVSYKTGLILDQNVS